jgi:ferric-dicitrate binding protein FerR (iron transport regulator)
MKKDPRDIDQRKLVLFLLDEISEAGHSEVEVWLERSQENRDEYEALKKTWEETGKLDSFPRKIDVDDVWAKFSEKLDPEISDESANSSSQPANPGSQLASHKLQSNKRTLRFLYAAAAVVFFTWISITMVRFIENGAFKPAVKLASLEQVIQDTLTDGSTIQLNENSTLTIAKRFNDEERNVHLEGEAFFEVKPDASKPFTVETGLGQIKVLGTSFQVKGNPETDVEVYVEEGRVELVVANAEGIESRIILTAGERGIITYPDGELRKGDAIQADDLFWANKKLIFEETRLSLVFDLLRKHYEAEIEVENDQILKCLLSATFNNEAIDQILEVIAASFELSVEKNQDKYIIKGKGCGNEQ